MIKLRDRKAVTVFLSTHDLHAASIIATEYVSAGPDGRIEFKSGGDSLCLLNVNFIMLQNASICLRAVIRS